MRKQRVWHGEWIGADINLVSQRPNRFQRMVSEGRRRWDLCCAIASATLDYLAVDSAISNTPPFLVAC